MRIRSASEVLLIAPSAATVLWLGTPGIAPVACWGATYVHVNTMKVV